MEKFSREMEELAAAWLEAEIPVVFTGAGMSTESGLPDFRSAQGLWRQRPESIATLAAMRTQPEEFYSFYQWRIARLWEVAPNPGHRVLSQLEQLGRLRKIITQNIDGLHQRAGSQQVTELHGSLRQVSCTQCGADYDSRQMLPRQPDWEAELQAGRHQPGEECKCPKCEGWLRPAVVLFGENLPADAWSDALTWSVRSDLFIVLGSSLVVSPANTCPELAADSARLAIINLEPTPLDDLATWIIRDRVAETLLKIRDLIVSEIPLGEIE